MKETWPAEKIFRDAQGRTRTERPLLTAPNSPPEPRVVELTDPSTGTEYILEPSHHIAHRFRNLAPANAESRQGEPIGEWVTEGFRAEGRRMTMHNATAEIWTAPELQAMVRRRIIDPLNGDSVEQLVSIHTGFQDANLFEVPSDYRIVDESGDFAIAYSVRGRLTLPVVLTRVQAPYTEAARRRGVQGKVYLALLVDENGRAADIHVERSLDSDLDGQAIKAVRQWRFQPAQRDGHSIRMPVHVEVDFSLSD